MPLHRRMAGGRRCRRSALDRYTALAALTHDPKIDDSALEAALRAELLLCRRARQPEDPCQARRAADGAGLRRGRRSRRIHAPIGLDIGAVEPGRDRGRDPGRDHRRRCAGDAAGARREVRPGPGRRGGGRDRRPLRPRRRGRPAKGSAVTPTTSPRCGGRASTRSSPRGSSRRRRRGRGGAPRSPRPLAGPRRARRARPSPAASNSSPSAPASCVVDARRDRRASTRSTRRSPSRPCRRFKPVVAGRDGRDGQDHPLRGAEPVCSTRAVAAAARRAAVAVAPFRPMRVGVDLDGAARPQGQRRSTRPSACSPTRLGAAGRRDRRRRARAARGRARSPRRSPTLAARAPTWSWCSAPRRSPTGATSSRPRSGGRRRRSSISACRSIPATCCCVGELGGKPVLGAPGCARSPKENGFDWVLDRLLAGMRSRARDIAGLGVGGLLMEIVRGRSRARRAGAPRTHDAAARRRHRAGRRPLALGGRAQAAGLFDGKPLVRHAAEAALAAGAAPVIVVTGHQADEVEAALAGLAAALVRNPDYAEGCRPRSRRASRRCPAERRPRWSCSATCRGVDAALLDDRPPGRARPPSSVPVIAASAAIRSLLRARLRPRSPAHRRRRCAGPLTAGSRQICAEWPVRRSGGPAGCGHDRGARRAERGRAAISVSVY